jgi:hypothetical protein
MNDNYTHIVFVLDRSGSMSSVRDDTIGGCNTFLQSQRELDGECTFTFVQFDNEYEVLHDVVPVGEVPDVTADTFVPRGMTALLDAIGRTVVSTGEMLNQMDEDERPSKVLFAIQTDGKENASSDFSRERINEMIKHQQDQYSWEFVFLGANQDAISEGQRLGIGAGKSLTYASNARGTSAAYDSLAKMSSAYRTTGLAPDFDASDRNEQSEAASTNT